MLSEKIKTLRVSQGLSQTDFAKRLFVTPGAVNQWEKGKTNPDTERLIAMAREFNIPLSYFDEGDKDRHMSEADLIREQIYMKIANLPQTAEAKILCAGIDKMPKEKREFALKMVKYMFNEYFNEGSTTNDDHA